jgi:peptidoglycan hydrolase-like protein with peptidoglycan-binding domain
VATIGKVKDAVAQAAAAGAAATGSFPLGGSVGRKGKNAPGDVGAVQRALGIASDGECGPKTIAAIEAYQRKLGAAKPDGRVDAGGATERALAGLAKPLPAEPSATVDSTRSIAPSYNFEPAWPTKLSGPGLSEKTNDLVDDLLQQQAALLQSLGNAGSDAEAEQIREELAAVGDEISMELSALKREEEIEAAELPEEEEPANTETDESYNEDLNVEDTERPVGPWRGERPLTADERTQAKKIYIDSIDYDKVSIAAGSLGSVGASRTLGNTICMEDENFEDNTSSLNDKGLGTLIHELGHVWQYQHGGVAYIPDALGAQAESAVTTGERSGAYVWRTALQEGKEWEDWNAEQQAQAMEDYFRATQRIEAAEAAGRDPHPDDMEVVRTLERYRRNVLSGQGAPGGSEPSMGMGDFVPLQSGDSIPT